MTAKNKSRHDAHWNLFPTIAASFLFLSLIASIAAIAAIIPISPAAKTPRPVKTPRPAKIPQPAKIPESAINPSPDFQALRLAITDLRKEFGEKYPSAAAYLEKLSQLEKDFAFAGAAVTSNASQAANAAAPTKDFNARFEALKREALFANPLLDFDRLLVIRRDPKQLGLPQNWEGNDSLPRNGYDNEIAILSPLGPDGKLTTLFKPPKGEFVGDVDLHFGAGRMLFSMSSGATDNRWRIWEIKSDGSGLRQLPLIEHGEVDNYDACYLPDGAVIFSSTAPFVGVPCVTGASHVANLYRYEPANGTIRQLTFDQDHNWCPTALPNGRVLYLRWEYSDIPHFVSRILFHMDPDGAAQMEYYGSNSYWPNAMFYARPAPNHATKFVAVVGGHHDNPRMGELVLFDAAEGRHE
ncbi:MAG: hypothetical protein NTX50_12210, partial [Candidatus Sumerlaeota bacterium]|nr:hypothetical protein [Candidatus Sumerlaeota bacterium]